MKYLSGLILMMILTGCAPHWQSRLAQDPEQLWRERQNYLAKLENWAFRGRTTIIQNREGWNAHIQWQEQGQRFHIKLAGPFLQGGMSLDGNNEAVTLTLDNGETISAATPEQLLIESVGWLLPVSALRDWVRGIPYAKLPIEAKQIDSKGRLTKLKQANWEIEFLRYMPFQDTSMPEKVFMKHSEINMRLIVSNWSIPK